MIFKFVATSGTIHLDVNEIQLISDLSYTEGKYGEDCSDNGFERRFFVGGGRSEGVFSIQLKGQPAPIKVRHEGRRLQDKQAAEQAAEATLTEKEKEYRSLYIRKLCDHMNEQPNTFVEGRKFKADYNALLDAWYKSKE